MGKIMEYPINPLKEVSDKLWKCRSYAEGEALLDALVEHSNNTPRKTLEEFSRYLGFPVRGSMKAIRERIVVHTVGAHINSMVIRGWK